MKPKKAAPSRKTVNVAKRAATDEANRCVPEYITESWTTHADALKMLVHCTALLKVLDSLNPESSGLSPEELANKAAELLHACHLQLKVEELNSAQRVKEKRRKLIQIGQKRSPMSFDEGRKALAKLSGKTDLRPKRVENYLRTLIGRDFDADPRQPREDVEYRRLNIDDLPRSVSTASEPRKEFIEREIEWYAKKGFSGEDFYRLESIGKSLAKR
jgi:hypothetical protein